MPAASSAAPTPGSATSSAAAATRSAGAVCTACTGRLTKYVRFTSRYIVITMPVPKASDSGTSRRGFFTSPAVKVMLFQASEAKSEPTCAMASATSRPPKVEASSPGAIGVRPAGVHGAVKFAAVVEAFQPHSRPMAIRPTTATVFAVVKTFWMMRP